MPQESLFRKRYEERNSTQLLAEKGRGLTRVSEGLM